jgi:hypothetical protein
VVTLVEYGRELERRLGGCAGFTRRNELRPMPSARTITVCDVVEPLVIGRMMDE